SCCPRQAQAMTVAMASPQLQSCGMCPPLNCDHVDCRTGARLLPEVAVCRGGHCVAQALKLDECATDSDCRLSTLSGCCPSCCAPQPVAVTARQQQHDEQVCAAAGACRAPDCRNKKCPAVDDVSALQPVCRAHKCVAERVHDASGSEACAKDSDCTMDPMDSCCGVC